MSINGLPTPSQYDYQIFDSVFQMVCQSMQLVMQRIDDALERLNTNEMTLEEMRERLSVIETKEVRREIEQQLQSKIQQVKGEVDFQEAKMKGIKKGRLINIVLVVLSVSAAAMGMIAIAGAPALLMISQLFPLSLAMVALGCGLVALGSHGLIKSSTWIGDNQGELAQQNLLRTYSWNTLESNQRWLKNYLPDNDFINFVKKVPNYRRLICKREIYKLYDIHRLREQIKKQNEIVEEYNAAYIGRLYEVDDPITAAEQLHQLNDAVAVYKRFQDKLNLMQREEPVLHRELGLSST